MGLSKEEIRERYKDLLENPHYSIFVYSLDGKIIDVNQAMLSQFGYTKDEVIGTPFRKYINKEDLTIAFKSIEGFKKTGGFPKAHIYRIRKKEGGHIYVEVFGIPLKDENDEVSAVLALGYDVTKLKIAEQQLKESEQKFRTIAEQSLIGIVILQHNIVKYANEKFAEISGYTTEEILDWKPGELFKIVHPDDKLRVIEQATKKMEGKPDVINHYDFVGIRKNREERRIEINSKTIKYENDFADLVLVVDVTEKYEAKLKLKQSEENYKNAYIRENFYKDLFAHDMNNILQNMMMTLEFKELKLGAANQDKTLFSFFQTFKDQIERAANLIKNVNVFSNLDESKITLNKMNLEQIINKVTQIPHQTKEGRTISINATFQNHELYIKADDFIYNVFENLLNNAIKHNFNTKVSIDIFISQFEKDGENFVKVEIKDNGKGIPDSKKESLFSRGIKGDRSVKGIGLGLSLVKAILDRYNAEIKVENNDSNDISKGSNFVILFPRGGE